MENCGALVEELTLCPGEFLRSLIEGPDTRSEPRRSLLGVRAASLSRLANSLMTSTITGFLGG
jgi:hypothetical protein